jgi:2-haloalkanoic acid dehalogenase type II
MHVRLTDYKVLTFDCYGTLIDWETGIFTAMQPLLALMEGDPGRDAALEVFAHYETAQESATPGMLYPELLAEVHANMRAHWSVSGSAELDGHFGRSVENWPAFPDSAQALAYLKQHYQLVILSNIDRGSFAASNEKLGVEFDAIYTAEDIGSYKPDPRNFEYMLEHLKQRRVDKGDILHTAQSLHHDHVQATAFGLATNWIDRRHDAEGFGATVAPQQDVRIDFHFPSMAAFAEAHKEAIG